MNREIVSLALLSILLLSSVGITSAQPVSIPNQGHMVVEGIGEPETVDPAWAYDTASQELIGNVYETLVRYETEIGKKLALVVGAPWDDWHNGYATDANAVEAYLKNNGWNVTKLLKAEATEGAILNKLKIIKKSAGARDYVLFYFSGHGSPPSVSLSEDDGEEGWIVSGAGETIVDDNITSWANGLRSEHVAIIIDACYSGEFIDEPYDPDKNIVVLTSTDKEEKAWAHLYPVWHMEHDYTHHLLRGLNRFSNILEFAHDYAKNKLTDQTPQKLDRYKSQNTSYGYNLAARTLSSPKPVLDRNWIVEDIDETDPATGVNWKQRYTFNIRTGVRFHSGDVLTTEDVEYSFERVMVQDRTGGPSWMLYESLLGMPYANLSDPLMDEKIDHAIQRNATHVWFNLVAPSEPFLYILSQSWASIVNKSFMAARGDWDGDWSVWTSFHDPSIAPVDVAGNVADGTGPYKLDYWTHGAEWSVVRFDDYWGGWPAAHCSNSLDRVTVKVVYEWGTRLADFRAGTADIVYAPRAYVGKVEDWPGIRGIKNLPTLVGDAIFFNFDITTPSPYVGSGVLDGNGIPHDFFADIRVRNAFAYSFDWNQYTQEAWLGEAWQSGGYSYDLVAAAAEFQAASVDPTSPAYGVMDIGFYFKIPYNVGNIPSIIAAKILKTNVESINPNFHVDTFGVAWSTFLGEMAYYPTYESIMPMYVVSWLAAYHSPTLPENAVVPLVQPLGRYYERDWVQGWYYNPIFGASLTNAADHAAAGILYFYHMWKGLNGDIDGDNTVGIGDVAMLASRWSSPAGPLGYDRIVDVYPYLQYSVDLASGTSLPQGMPSIGEVDIYDWAAINAHWGEYA